MTDLEGVSQRLLEIKEAVENDEYEPHSLAEAEIVSIRDQAWELREIVGEWQFANLPRDKQRAALL